MNPLLLLVALAAPWWDDWPTTVQAGDAETAAPVAASSVLCGQVDDPCWGTLGARVRQLAFAQRAEGLRALGVPLLSWVETFGTSQSYLARLERRPDGGLLGFDLDPATPRPTLNHWAWQLFAPRDNDRLVWIGLPEYYNDAAWARPYTRAHIRYGAPPMRYPDGREASGYALPGREDTSLVWDAGGSKDILGRLNLTYDANDQVTAGAPPMVPFETQGRRRWASSIAIGKDAACPHWIEYARASARYLADQGMRGVWADNFSAWDNLGHPPVRIAFGDWSVARFREHLARVHTPDELAALGVDDLATFDIRAHLRRVMREKLAGDDTDLDHPAWRDPRWRDEPLWRDFLIFKERIGREALQAFHDAFHGAARETGIEDFAIQGNDIPIYCFGMPRPESLEMVSTEFSPGWNLAAGPRGVGFPPGGRLAPIVRLAQCHSRGRFVHVWYYLEEHQGYDRYRGNDAVGRTIGYELLASGGAIQAQPALPKVAGSVATQAEINRFIAACRPIWGDRVPLATVGLVYSPHSDLGDLTPGGFVQFERQEHRFELLGWATALSWLGVPYTMVPEWDLTPRRLAPLRVLVLPSVKVLAPEVLTQVVIPWVRAGGRLHLTGATGTRHDAGRGFAPADTAAGRHRELCRLVRIDPERPLEQTGTSAPRPLGAGAVRFTPAFEGLEYYQIDPAERTLEHLTLFRAWIRTAAVLGDPLPGFEVGYWTSPGASRVFVDLADVRLRPDATEPAETALGPLTLALPGAPDGVPRGRLLTPGREPVAVTLDQRGGAVVVPPTAFRGYLSIVIDGWRSEEQP